MAARQPHVRLLQVSAWNNKVYRTKQRPVQAECTRNFLISVELQSSSFREPSGRLSSPRWLTIDTQLGRYIDETLQAAGSSLRLMFFLSCPFFASRSLH